MKRIAPFLAAACVFVLIGSAASAGLIIPQFNPPLTITMQPSDQNTLIGGTALFSVTADGTEPLFYRWQKDRVDLFDGGQFFGAATSGLTVGPVTMADAAAYRCVVTDNFGIDTSDEATLTVSEALIPEPAGLGLLGLALLAVRRRRT